MRKPCIHQFHSGSAVGDAVTASLFYTQRLLRELGFESEIYVEHIAPELKSQLKPHTEYNSNAENVLLLHHSMGHDRLDWIQSLADRKILVYHNVTPPRFFEEGSHIQRYAIKGREMLGTLRSLVLAAVADSEENAIELRDIGYDSPMVVPLLLDQRKIALGSWNFELVQRESRTPVILFVGRVVNNKCQHDLIALAESMRRLNLGNFKLVCVGGFNKDDVYYKELIDRVIECDLCEVVHFTGKVSDDDLRGWYRAASVFVSMSEHEGFGVPFVESMLFDLPIVAFRSSAIPYVLGEAGIIFDEKDFDRLAILVSEVIENRGLRRSIIAGQRRRVKDFSEPEIIRGLASVLNVIGVNCDIPQVLLDTPDYPPFSSPSWQFEGPFESSYSLALVNRQLALAMERRHPGATRIWPTEGPGDYQPDSQGLANHPEAAAIYFRTRKASQPDVLVRNLWPPRLRDMDGLLNLSAFAWEESAIPSEIVEEINASVDGLIAPSEFCRKTYVDNGIKVPICIYGHGCNHFESVVARLPRPPLPGKFRFLHVSSAFPRKGVDILLKAFESAFAGDTDVVLVLKTFPNPHNTVKSMLDAIRRRSPAVVDRIYWINEDMDESDIKGLYESCHAFVAPTRGEGFGLPMAEAMAIGLPVITTDQGAQADFCTEATSWTVRSQPTVSQSHVSHGYSCWFEPDSNHLAERMMEVRRASHGTLAAKTSIGARLIHEQFTWDKCAQRIDDFIITLKSRPIYPKQCRVGFVTTWNSKCGIATYSQYLVEKLRESSALNMRVYADKGSEILNQDESYVSRNWLQDPHPSCSLANLRDEILADGCEVVIMQFNFGFFNIATLGALLDDLHATGVATLLCFHSTQDVDKPDLKASLGGIRKSLGKCRRLLVHTPSDIDRLRGWGLTQNAVFFPHGVISRVPYLRKDAKLLSGISESLVIATFGFCLPHKGLLETIEAFSIFLKTKPHSRLMMLNALHSAPASADMARRCAELIDQLGIRDRVTVRHDFVSDSECLALLDSADMAVFAYGNTNESASGAVRLALASGATVVCSPIPIFDDVRPAVHFAEGGTPQDIANSLIRIASDDDLVACLAKSRSEYLHATKWQSCANRLEAMCLEHLNAPHSTSYLS